jgi:hypothetical protein
MLDRLRLKSLNKAGMVGLHLSLCLGITKMTRLTLNHMSPLNSLSTKLGLKEKEKKRNENKKKIKEKERKGKKRETHWQELCILHFIYIFPNNKWKVYTFYTIIVH